MPQTITGSNNKKTQEAQTSNSTIAGGFATTLPSLKYHLTRNRLNSNAVLGGFVLYQKLLQIKKRFLLWNFLSNLNLKNQSSIALASTESETKKVTCTEHFPSTCFPWFP